MRTHKEIFTEIYDKNVWGGSGGGSTPENTVEYRALLQKFMKDNDIKTVVDYGCGDWGFSNQIDWTGIKYLGIDCVESVIELNRLKYGTDDKIFYHQDYVPPFIADLLIVKDVFQHWSNNQIDDFFNGIFYNPNLVTNNPFKYILITNTASQEYDAQDIEPGQTRGLCARFEPLKKYNPEIMATIKTTITSEVLLIKR